MKKQPLRSAQDMETAVNRYGDMLYRLCVLMLKNESDAEDAVQETMIKFYQKAPAFENGEHEKAWLLACAANVCKDELKSARRKKRSDFPDDVVDDRERAETVDGALSPGTTASDSPTSRGE